jgi:dTDP-4-amino-4,6-dideoxygalactose transaminase
MPHSKDEDEQSMTIQPADPKGTFERQREEILGAVHRVLEGGSYILGPETRAFEQEFAAYLGGGTAVGVASGTDALQLGLRALGVGAGDSVLTVSHTAVATVAAIEMTGARAVLVDIEDDRMTMSPESLLKTITALSETHRFRAVIPVHLYGQPADMPAISGIAGRFGLSVLEDCAQAHGAAIGDRKVGTFGEASAFSFYPTKNLGAFGDAGAVCFADAGVAARARALREYGWRERYVSDEPGVNSRLDELHAAMLRVKLPHLDQENDRRRSIAALYNEALRHGPFQVPAEAPGTGHVYHQYVIRTNRRDDLRSYLAARGINTLVHYPFAVHEQAAYRGRLDLSPGGVPVTERICRQILSLPMHSGLSDEDAQTVCEALRAFS